jgi:uncharacterized protein (DUF169 family)
MDNRRLAEVLSAELKLERPPVALAFVEQAPKGMAGSSGPAPSACTFWRRAQDELFYASAEEHYECPVGAMTMGFDLPPEQGPRAEQLVGTMVELGYFGMEEVPHLSSVRKPHAGIVYGPLERFTLRPDAVMVQVTPFQAMLLAEATGGATLRESPELAVMGRPACAVVARATNESAVTMSVGCIGARTYVELPDDRALLVLPAERLEQTVERLPALAWANEVLAGFHRGQKERIEGAQA